MADMNHIQKENVLSPETLDSGNRTQSGFTSIALKGLFIIASFYTIYFSRALIFPLGIGVPFDVSLKACRSYPEEAVDSGMGRSGFGGFGPPEHRKLWIA